jgi:hypothetical protein
MEECIVEDPTISSSISSGRFPSLVEAPGTIFVENRARRFLGICILGTGSNDRKTDEFRFKLSVENIEVESKPRGTLTFEEAEFQAMRQ